MNIKYDEFSNFKVLRSNNYELKTNNKRSYRDTIAAENEWANKEVNFKI